MQITVSDQNISAFCARWRAAAPDAPEPTYHSEGFVVVPDDLGELAQAIVAAGFAPTKSELRAYTASVRYAKEIAGVVVNGTTYPTDRETQAKLTAAVLLTQASPQAVLHWKVGDGSFVELDAAGLMTVAVAAGNYVQACFIKEAEIVSGIELGTVTNRGQVDVAFANVGD